ncbi:MAG: 50S ribosomal protein L11 methyltransferase [Christensenellales bacterium]|jgi:ribosomal protein L11 methyltransferase
MMRWLTYTVHTTTEASDLIGNLLIEAGSRGVMIEDKNDIDLNQRVPGQWDIIDEAIAARMGEDVKVTGYYPIDERLGDTVAQIESELKRIRALGLDFDLGTLETNRQAIDEEDWAQSWKSAFKPFRLGERMVVKPGWETYAPRAGDKIIEIDPGMAFGTGTHETTGLCVELIEAYVKPGMDVIDIGTGTGILAIAAAHMGARGVLATDLDPMAVKIAAENIEINGFAGVIRTRAGDLLDAVDEQADIVTANIITDVILAIAAPVRAHIRTGGMFICSGIPRARKGDVLRALTEAGYQSLDARERGEWMAVAGVKAED